MKFQKITICNFKNYRGKYTIDFSQNGSKKQNNIILIGGENGSGKTTLVEGLKLCLYGKRGMELSAKKYQEYIIDSKNRSSTKMDDRSFFIEMNIEVDDSYPLYQLSLKREWEIRDNNSIEERFEIIRDGAPFQIVPSEYWEDYILSLIPPYISDYFFFDGERVKDLAIGDRADSILRESIRDLIGLKSFETLYNDLEILKNKILKRNAERSTLTGRITDMENGIANIEREIDESQKLIIHDNNKIASIRNEKHELEDELRRKAGVYAERRKKLEKRIIFLEEKSNSLNEEIKGISGDYLPFIMASKTCKALLDQLAKERMIKELKSSKDTMQDIKRDLINRITQNQDLNRDLNEAQIRVVITEVNKLFSEKFNLIEDGIEMSLIHDLSLTDSFKIEEFIKNIGKNIRGTLETLLKNREEIISQLDKCHKELNKVPSDMFIKEYVEKISASDSEIRNLSNEVENLKSNMPSLEIKKNERQKELKELNKKIICVQEDDKKIQICCNSQKTIREFIDKATSLKIRDLEEKITFMYHLLANKDDMVDQIKLDPVNFTAQLVGYNGESIRRESISAGEKEVYALSVLWGLVKISEKKVPMIIDSPLAKLDSRHVDKIVEKFFPNAAETVIILSHDREIDEGLYSRMAPYINRSYKLSLNESDKVREGYFFN